MKVKVRKILLCVFFALFIVTLFTASFSLGRYSSVQSSESNYDDDFEYTLYDSIVVNTIDEFFAAISNGYNYIIIGDAIKDPLIIAGSMSDIRDDLIIDLNGHEIQRNSRDPLLNVTTGFTLTIIDKVGTGSMYNPVGSVIQVSGGTLTVQNGIFESGPRSDNSRHALGIEANYGDYNEYATGSNNNWTTPGGGSISSGPAAVILYTNPIIKEGVVNATDSAEDYGTGVTANLPVIMPKFDVGADGDMTNGSMYFDENTNPQYGSLGNNNYIIENDTYLYYTFESDNMQYSEAADKSTANYYYQYYVAGGDLGDTQDSVDSYFTYAGYEGDGGTHDNNILVTVYVYNDVKGYANNDYYPVDSSSDNTGFAAVKMQSGNLYVRGGTYYSYFGEENTFGVQSTGGLMTVNPVGNREINFYSYENGVCVECTVDTPTKTEMLNISNGNFYSELGDTVRVQNGNLVIGTADFTKDVGSASANSFGDNGNVIDISGGTLTINTRAGFDVSGSGVNGIYSHDGDNTSVRVANATFNFNTNGDSLYNAGIFARAGSVSCESKTTINFSSGNELKAQHVCGIYSAGGTIECGIPQTHLEETGLTINIATSGSCENSYGIYANGGDTITHDTTNITIGNTGSVVTSSQGIHAENGEVNLGKLYSEGSVNSRTGDTTITVNGLVSNDKNETSSAHNFGIQTLGGTINTDGTTTVTVYGTDSTGVYATVSGSSTVASSINISGQQFTCNVHMHEGSGNNATYVQNLSSTAISTAGGNIEFNVGSAEINSDGLGITAFNMRVNEDGTLDSDHPITGSGNVEFKQSSLSNVTNEIDLNTLRGTAMYIQGGSVTINSGVTFDVESNTSWELGWQQTNDTPHSHDGILVNGGSLVSYGTLNVEHVGVENDSVILDDGDNDTEWDPKNTAGNNAHIDAQRAYGNDGAQFSSDNLPIYNSTNAYYEFVIKSYAVRVEGIITGYDQNNDPIYSSDVTITKGNIVNQVTTGNNGNQVGGGGGVYVSGGNVTLGQQGATAENDLSISATGTDAFAQYFHVTDAATNWSARLPRTGGHAVQVTGGELTINSGTYNSALGNGILLTNGNITVNDGTIVGGDHTYNSSQSSYDPCGAAASYCLKVCGGTININGGIFGSEPVLSNGNYVNSSVTSSGAFVMGTTTTSDGTTTINRGTANITKGTFNVYGQSAFAVYQHATVTFGKADGTGSDKDIFVRGFAAGLTVENSAESSIFVTIYNGEFRGFRNLNGDGIWFGNRYALTRIFGGQFIGETRYGLNIDNGGRLQISGGTFKGSQAGLWYGNGSAKLTITGGQFTGTSKSGLYFDVAPDGQLVQISGGEFSGYRAINSDVSGSITTGNIIKSGSWCFNAVVNDLNNETEKRQKAICDRSRRYEFPAFRYYFNHVGGGRSINLDDDTYVNGGDRTALNNRAFIAIYICDPVSEYED